MDMREAYLVGQKNCGIEVGDTVKVLRRAKDHENGWRNGWAKVMDSKIGATFLVTRIHDSGAGIYIDGLGFPWFVLELVKKAKPAFNPISVRLNSEYVAVVGEDSVTVGCQKFPLSKVRELLGAVELVEQHLNDG